MFKVNLSCAIVTQAANNEFESVHDRMPLSLSVAQAQRWLDPNLEAGALLEELNGTSLPMRFRAVSTKVNNARNKDAPEFMDAKEA